MSIADGLVHLGNNTVLKYITAATERSTDEFVSLGASVLAALTFVFLLIQYGAMSWLKFGNLDRFSPFTRSPPQGSTTVSDADYSYITNEDLRRHDVEQHVTPVEEAPRETDNFLLRHKKTEYTVHFPTNSIADGGLRIKSLRDAAAKRMGIEAKKVKLVYKGRVLNNDRLQCRAEGLRSGSELLCSNEDSEFFSDLDESEEESTKKKKKKKSKRKGKQEVDDDWLTIPAPSRGPSTGTATPLTAMEKVDALRDNLESYEPDVQAFLRNPPSQASKREFDRKRISETLLAQVLLKTDAIETEGDPAVRAARKELVRDVQDVLKTLDEAHGGKASG